MLVLLAAVAKTATRPRKIDAPETAAVAAATAVAAEARAHHSTEPDTVPTTTTSALG